MQNPQAGLVVVLVAVLWIAYLVPHRLRTRQDMLEARTQDRFSADLRVIRAARERAVEVVNTVSATPLLARPRAQLARVEVNMDRAAIETARRTAAERSQRAATLARRAAGARRRLVLVGALVALAAGLWVASVSTAFPAWPVFIPAGLAVGVLAAGVAAMRAARRADAAYAERLAQPVVPTARLAAHMIEPSVPVARPADSATVPPVRGERVVEAQGVVEARGTGLHSTGLQGTAQRATGHAYHPSEQMTEVLLERPAERNVATSGEGIPILHPADSTLPAERRPTVWVPRPVPAPAYTLKSKVSRPAGTQLEFGSDGRLATGVDTTAQTVADVLSEPDVITTGSLDLEDILARRRASGL